MSEREFYMYTVSDEIPRFERAVSAVPQEHDDYKPDPKSKTAMELATMMAGEAGTIKTLLTEGDLDFTKVVWPTFTTPAEAAAELVRALKESKTIAEGLSDEQWDAEGRMHMNGQNEWKNTRGKLAFSFLLDMIHHRGQLSTYFRAMGGKTPSIYGPSADSAE